MTRLIVTHAARGDLRDIRRFSKERFGLATTRAYLSGLNATFVLLVERPGVGALQSDLAPGTRAFSYRSHRIYYRLMGERCEVLRILHHARSDARSDLT